MKLERAVKSAILFSDKLIKANQISLNMITKIYLHLSVKHLPALIIRYLCQIIKINKNFN